MSQENIKYAMKLIMYKFSQEDVMDFAKINLEEYNKAYKLSYPDVKSLKDIVLLLIDKNNINIQNIPKLLLIPNENNLRNILYLTQGFKKIVKIYNKQYQDFSNVIRIVISNYMLNDEYITRFQVINVYDCHTWDCAYRVCTCNSNDERLYKIVVTYFEFSSKNGESSFKKHIFRDDDLFKGYLGDKVSCTKIEVFNELSDNHTLVYDVNEFKRYYSNGSRIFKIE